MTCPGWSLTVCSALSLLAGASATYAQPPETATPSADPDVSKRPSCTGALGSATFTMTRPCEPSAR